MEYTKNLNLKKPDVNEYYNIEQENENKDLIDSAIGELNSQVGTETLTTTAQDCTGAINELNKNLSWKLHSSHIGTGLYDLPAEYEELIVRINKNNDGISFFVLIFCRIQLEDTVKYYGFGNCASTQAYVGGLINISKSKIQLYSYYDNGTNVASTSSFDVYYR